MKFYYYRLKKRTCKCYKAGKIRTYTLVFINLGWERKNHKYQPQFKNISRIKDNVNIVITYWNVKNATYCFCFRYCGSSHIPFASLVHLTLSEKYFFLDWRNSYGKRKTIEFFFQLLLLPLSISLNLGETQ